MKERAVFLRQWLMVCAAVCSVYVATAQKNTHTYKRLFEPEWQRLIINGAGKFYPSHPQFFCYLDSALAVYPDDAFLYQQKAISYYKIAKNEAAGLAMQKAVQLDSPAYIHYYGFAKTIFEKAYREALPLLQSNPEKRPYIADHTPVFYQGLCYLQLGDFVAAEKAFADEIAFEEKGIIHFMNEFYLAVCYIEQKKYDKAKPLLDKLMDRYPNFAEAYFYSGIVAYDQKNHSTAHPFFEKALKLSDAGFTFTEEYALYERYPYQLIREQAAFYFEKTKPIK